jgi:hypothetical protein
MEIIVTKKVRGEPQRFIAVAIPGSGCGIEAEGDKKKEIVEAGRAEKRRKSPERIRIYSPPTRCVQSRK